MLIAEIIKNGILFDLKNWQHPMIELGSIRRLLDLLAARQISYLLVGGVAMLCYIEGRNTQDIDFLISLDELERLPELEIVSRDRDFARANFDGLQVDLLLTSNALFEDVLIRHAGTQQIGGDRICCVTPPGLLLLKLYALPSLYRQGEFQRANLYEGDITALLLQFPDLDSGIDRMLTTLQGHLLASDVESLSAIVQEIRQRLSRMRR